MLLRARRRRNGGLQDVDARQPTAQELELTAGLGLDRAWLAGRVRFWGLLPDEGAAIGMESSESLRGPVN
jgi:hypothetical protein